uniref:Uncharacterized protein n=1 Tax=Toxoplasma gondii (strain ATCC 50861 / VEG) TaxID=432359 RepID=A0A0F7V3I0_TOXGV|nr:TPA: hypothetical protein BN1205_079190 [Toxoplasma gondii VEG]
MGNAPNRDSRATGVRTDTSGNGRGPDGAGVRHDGHPPVQPSNSSGVPASTVSAFCPSVVIQSCVAMKEAAECGQCLDGTEEKIAAVPRSIVLPEQFFPLTIDADRPNKFLFITNTYHDDQTRHRTALHDCANTVGALQRLLMPSLREQKHGDSPRWISSPHYQRKETMQRSVTLENSSITFIVNRPKARFLQEFDEFCHCIQPGDSVCVYYSGFATQVSAQPCLVTPTSHSEARQYAKPQHNMKRNAVNLVDMVDSVAARSPRLVCFILDCAADFDARHRRALPISVGLPMIYEFVGDKVIIMQSLAPGASLSSELLSQRTTTAEDYAAYTGLREPQEEEMERYEKGHEALSLTSTLHSPVRGRKVSRWDSEGRGRPYQDPSEENSNGETNVRRYSCDSQEMQDLDHIEVPCDVKLRTPYESFLAHAKRSCGPDELASMPGTWESCIEPCSNLSFCINQASRSLAKGTGLDFVRMAQLIASLVYRVTGNTQAFCCLTNM